MKLFVRNGFEIYPCDLEPAAKMFAAENGVIWVDYESRSEDELLSGIMKYLKETGTVFEKTESPVGSGYYAYTIVQEAK